MRLCGWLLSIVLVAFSVGNAALNTAPPFRSVKILRVLNPWTNTSPSVVYNGGADTTAMIAVENYCGWFQATIPSDCQDVLFIQTVGMETYGGKGLTSVELIDVGYSESADDTIWVNSNGGGLPIVGTAYPKILGECPVRKLSVMMFDWYDGSRDNHRKYNPKTRSAELCGERCTKTYGGEGVSADFGGDNVNLCWPNSPVSSKDYSEEDRNLTDYNAGVDEVLEGMVLPDLGARGVPVRNELFDWAGKCKNAEHLNRWFLPETLVVKNGKSYTNATCRELSLVLDADGVWRGQMDRSTDSSTGDARGGMFLIDDFQFLDEEKTIPNPYYDSIPSGFAGIDGSGKMSENAYHNYGLSMKIQANFVYVPGQYFEFLGDDDVWVFIDGRLAVDIGGVHDRRRRAVNLDTIGRRSGDTLVSGESYSFDIFYTERYKVEGNFKMRTSIDLRTSVKYYSLKDWSLSSGAVKAYTIMQNIRTDGLECDFSATSEDVPAPSYFRLFGGNLPAEGIALEAGGTYYEGIVIQPSMSGFSIDTAKISGLVPGKYSFEFTSQANENARKTISFTVPEPEVSMPKVGLVFADSAYETIDADTVAFGKWAGVLYPVYVSVDYDTLISTELFLVSSNPNLIFADSTGSQIRSVAMKNSRGKFFVMALDSVTNASFMVQSGAIGNVLVWSGITLREPPVPKVALAEMHDRDGDGSGDSIYVSFSKSFLGKDSPDSILWNFGYPGSSRFENFVRVDSHSVAYFEKAGFYSAVFTGGGDEVYNGSVYVYQTYEGEPFVLNGVLEDRIGAVLTSASLSVEDDISVLTIGASEAFADSQPEDWPRLFEFRRWRSGILYSEIVEASYAVRIAENRIQLYFHVLAGDAPAPGDSVRLIPGMALDLAGNAPHRDNPWVRITGGGQLNVETSTVVTLNPESAPLKESSTVEALGVESGVSAETLSKRFGRHGQLLAFDGVRGALEEVNADLEDGMAPYTAEDIVVSYEVRYFTNLGEFVNAASGMLRCTDGLFDGDCTLGEKALFLAWNMRGASGRLVGAGAYVAQSEIRLRVGKKVLKQSFENVWGVRRGFGVIQ